MSWRYACLWLLAVGSLIGLMCVPPFAQDVHYHDFADRQAWLGVPNFFNVISNLPFLIVGCAGWRFCRKSREQPMIRAWRIFFVGVGLVSLGSGWYHLNPANGSLVWDRLPMTIGFMAMTAALLGECASARWGRRLLWPLLVTGAWSVLHWHWYDDLRFYGWVQFAPMLVIPAMLVLFPRPNAHRGWLWLAVLFYALAKVLEALDWRIFHLTGGVLGGHPLKHLSAAAACWMILEMLKRRSPVPSS